MKEKKKKEKQRKKHRTAKGKQKEATWTVKSPTKCKVTATVNH